MVSQLGKLVGGAPENVGVGDLPDRTARSRRDLSSRPDDLRAQQVIASAELKPLVDEYNRLQDASKALAGVRGSSAPSTSAVATNAPARRPGRPPGSKNRKSTGARRARPPKTATATALASKSTLVDARVAARAAGSASLKRSPI